VISKDGNIIEGEIYILTTWFLDIWTWQFDGDKWRWPIKEWWYNDGTP